MSVGQRKKLGPLQDILVCFGPGGTLRWDTNEGGHGLPETQRKAALSPERTLPNARIECPKY